MRILLVLASLIAVTASQGASPSPGPVGRLFDIGGRNLHLICRGSGSPVVILESGAGGFSVDWALAQPLIAKTTRVCAYDRAGYAWSDMSPGFEQLQAVAEDLRMLTREAALLPPFVLAGHAMGAIYARDYQRRFPQDVAGLVLVDPTPEEDFQVKMFGNTVSLIDLADHDLRAWPVRPFAPSLTSPPPRRPPPGTGAGEPFNKLPRNLQTARAWALQRFFANLDSLTDEQALAVMESERAAFIELYNARHNPATSPLRVPVVVLSRGKDTNPRIREMQDELARLSANPVHRTAVDSGTQIQIEQPDFVAAAVADVVNSIKGRQPLR